MSHVLLFFNLIETTANSITSKIPSYFFFKAMSLVNKLFFETNIRYDFYEEQL